MIALKNKEIFDIKLSITTDCFFDCKYCFVKKNKKTMTFATAKKVIDLVMRMPPKDKIIRVYGGEPLLYFDLLKKISKYARQLEKKMRKELTLTLCTNAFLLNKNYLDFLKDYDYKLAISIDGKKATHEKYRGFKDKKEDTYKVIQRSVLLALKNNSKYNVTAGVGVTPDSVGHLRENLNYILNMGFDTVNIEPIYGFQNWGKGKQMIFYQQMKNIIKFIINQLQKKRFIFLTTINRELKYRTISEFKKGRCLFYQSMEVNPDGEIGFSSFLINSSNRDKYLIGNINDNVLERYKNCRYSRGSQKCRDCIASYFDFPDATLTEEIVDLRDLLSIEVARFIEKMAEKNKNFAHYITEAKKHMCL